MLPQFLLGRRRLRRPDLPRSPRTYVNERTGTVFVTGRHTTYLRYQLAQGLIGLARRAALLMTLLLGVCLLPETDGELNGLQSLRVRIDRTAHRVLPASIVQPIARGLLLQDWAYAVPFVGILLLGGFFKMIGRDVIATGLMGKRTSLKFSANKVTRYLFGIVPLTCRQGGGVKIQFRVADDPDLPAQNRAPRDQPVLFEMILGARRVPIAGMLGMPTAEAFVVAADAALKLAGELAGRRKIRTDTRMPAGIRALE